MDQQVEAPAESIDGGGQVETVRLVGHVAGHRVDGRGGAEIGGRGAQVVLAAGVDDELPAVDGESPSPREAPVISARFGIVRAPFLLVSVVDGTDGLPSPHRAEDGTSLGRKA